MKSVGRTVLGVRMGCHAFSRCCLKAVSEGYFVISYARRNELSRKRTGRLSPAALFLLSCLLAVALVCPPAVSSEESHNGTSGGEER